MAYDLDEQRCGIVILNDPEAVREGQGVTGLSRLPDLPVGEELLGRIVDALGQPLDEGLPISTTQRFPLFRETLKLVERKAVDQSLWTGVMGIDAAIPIGRGQRELIIGDRNTGKTALVDRHGCRAEKRRCGLRLCGDRSADVARVDAEGRFGKSGLL